MEQSWVRQVQGRKRVSDVAVYFTEERLSRLTPISAGVGGCQGIEMLCATILVMIPVSVQEKHDLSIPATDFKQSSVVLRLILNQSRMGKDRAHRELGGL
jgi:hypothetical protein